MIEDVYFAYIHLVNLGGGECWPYLHTRIVWGQLYASVLKVNKWLGWVPWGSNYTF